MTWLCGRVEAESLLWLVIARPRARASTTRVRVSVTHPKAALAIDRSHSCCPGKLAAPFTSTINTSGVIPTIKGTPSMTYHYRLSTAPFRFLDRRPCLSSTPPRPAHCFFNFLSRHPLSQCPYQKHLLRQSSNLSNEHQLQRSSRPFARPFHPASEWSFPFSGLTPRIAQRNLQVCPQRRIAAGILSRRELDTQIPVNYDVPR
jgi:hypothetical protein